MKEVGVAHLLRILLEQSQDREKASQKRICELENQISELLKRIDSLQEIMAENNTTIEQLINELKLFSPKNARSTLKRINEAINSNLPQEQFYHR